MECIKNIVIMNKKGIHARTAAMIVSFINQIKNKYGVKLYIQKENEDTKMPISSMLALVSLKIKQGDTIRISCIGSNSKDAIDEIESYISGEIDQKINDIEEFDKVLEENTINITSEFESIKEIRDKLGNILDRISYGISNAIPTFSNGDFKGVTISYNDVITIRNMMNELDCAQEKIKYYKEQLNRKDNVHEAFNFIIGKSSSLNEAIAMASKAAKTSATVIITGESGTGKELVAKAIHEASKRKNEPFIKINCAAIPETLLESELFGHEKGSFTGAVRRKIGKFELANKGTLFLDEIGEISYNLQAKILRAIQEKEIERIGAAHIIKTNIRIITATNRNLEEMVSNNTFREDLYYRLNVIPIILPPLRKRKGDIPILADHFIKKICSDENIKFKKITKKALECLEEYYWPGNIRELENILTRAIALTEENEINMDSFPSYITINSNNTNNNLINVVDGDLATMKEYDKEIIKLALKKYSSFNKAAKALGITHRTVALKAKKYDLL